MSKTGLLDLQLQVQIPGMCNPASGAREQLPPANPVLQRTVLSLKAGVSCTPGLRSKKRSLEEKRAPQLHFFAFSLLQHSLSPAPLPLQQHLGLSKRDEKTGHVLECWYLCCFPLSSARPALPCQASSLVPGITFLRISINQRFGCHHK